MSRQYFTGQDAWDWVATNSTAIASFATMTQFWTVNAYGTYIPAYDLRAGKGYILNWGGVMSATAGSTIQIAAYFGASTTFSSNLAMGTSGTATLPALSAAPFFGQFMFGCRLASIATASSTIVGNGFMYVEATITSKTLFSFGGTVVTTADYTTAQGIVIGGVFSAATASNTITTLWAVLRTLN